MIPINPNLVSTVAHGPGVECFRSSQGQGRPQCASTRAAVSRKVSCVLLDEPLRSAEHDLGRAPGRRAPGAEREAERGAERGHLEHAQSGAGRAAGLAAMAARALVGRLVGHMAKLR